jgi:hypothetical protein
VREVFGSHLTCICRRIVLDGLLMAPGSAATAKRLDAARRRSFRLSDLNGENFRPVFRGPRTPTCRGVIRKATAGTNLRVGMTPPLVSSAPNSVGDSPQRIMRECAL